MRNDLCKFILCNILGNHKWTTDYERRGNVVDPNKVINMGVFKAWLADSRMYCNRCGKESDVSIRFRNRMEKEPGL